MIRAADAELCRLVIFQEKLDEWGLEKKAKPAMCLENHFSYVKIYPKYPKCALCGCDTMASRESGRPLRVDSRVVCAGCQRILAGGSLPQQAQAERLPVPAAKANRNMKRKAKQETHLYWERRLDSLGRITIPSAMYHQWGLDKYIKQNMYIDNQGAHVLVYPAIGCCALCGQMLEAPYIPDRHLLFNGRAVCPHCLGAVRELVAQASYDSADGSAALSMPAQ